MESELGRVLNVLPTMAWTALPNGHVDFVNPQWCGYTGHGADKAHGHGWQDAVHPQDLPELQRRWQSIRAGGEPGDMQARLRRFDGAYRWFDLRVRPVAGAQGKVVKWCGVNIDIEDLRRAEQCARASEVNLRSIVDSIPAFMALAAPSGEVEYFNRNAQDYLGMGLDQLTGSKARGLVHTDDLPAVMEAWEHALETGEPYQIEHRVRRGDGAYHWFDVRGLPIKDAEGRITRWCVVDVDIDDQKQDKALLAGEKRLLEMVVRGHSRPEVLDALCQLVEDTIGSCYCSIVLVDASGMRMEYGAAPSLSASFIGSVIGLPVCVDAGPCAMAACLVEQVLASDLATETRWQFSGWCDMAVAHGLHACWSTPITADAGQVLGTIAIYYDRARSPSPRELALINQLTHIASIAIERQRSQTNLARALEEVKSSEDRLRTIIDAIPGFVWSAEPNGRVDFFNQRWCDYTGMSMADSFGRCWDLTIHPEDAVRLRAYWQSLLESGEAGEAEARLLRHDRTYRWFLIRMVPLRDGAGRLVKWFGQNTDIEDRKRAEMLLAGEKRLLKMIAQGSALAAVLDVLCTLVEATISGCSCSIQLTDARRAHRRSSMSVSIWLQPGAAPNLPAELQAGSDDAPVHVGLSPGAMAAVLGEQVVCADLVSEKRWNEWRSMALLHEFRAACANPIGSSTGQVLGIFTLLYREPTAATPAQQGLIAQLIDLASIAIERARSEAALKQSEAFLVKAQRLSLTGTFSWRATTNEITWSDEVYRIFELNQTVTPTYDLIDARLHPDDIEAYRDVRKRQRLEGRDFEHEHRLLMPDGRVKYLHLVAHATRGVDGGLEYIAALQDVTQRRLTDEALDKVRSELAHVARVATLGELTASIAHEVNQPLAGIITNANTCLRMLATTPPNVEGARETARRTIRDGERASGVIKRLRALFAKKGVASETVDLNEAAREVAAMLQGELQRSSIVVHADYATNLPCVVGDRVQLQQVVLNLLLNAADAVKGIVDRPRTILISTGLDRDDQVRLTVRDSGVGFDPSDEEKMFSAFYTTKNGGMGIGLSISRSIIESHSGRLWAAPNDGEGAAFSFCVPCTSYTADQPCSTRADRAKRKGTGAGRAAESC